MTIGKLAEMSGVPASTIRYWEKIGVLPLSTRVSGQRRYSGNDIEPFSGASTGASVRFPT